VTITATVENTGNEAGTFTAELQIDGEPVDTEDVEVPAGETREVTFAYTFEEAGEYDITVNGVTAGSVTASEGSGTATPGGPEEPGGPIVDPVSPIAILLYVLVVLIVGGLLVYYQREERFPWESGP